VEEQAEAALASEDVVELRHELVEAMAKADKISEENSMLRSGRTGARGGVHSRLGHLRRRPDSPLAWRRTTLDDLGRPRTICPA